MAGKWSTPEQIVAKLRQVEVLTAQGKAVAEAVRAIGVSEPTHYRWRAEYGGLKAALTLEKVILKEAASGNL